jgi:beta-lactam-binding protein with PASTA domain
MPPNVGARLVLAVPIQVEPAVEVPSLSGLTQQEAQKALESIGLVLGKVSVLQKQLEVS